MLVGHPFAQLVVAVGCLICLLAVAFAHHSAAREGGAGLLAALVVWSTGAVTWESMRDEAAQLGPVVAFLMAILVVAACARDEGLFTALGTRLGRVRRPQHALTAVFAIAIAVTITLSLDATVVLLTPVVVAAMASAGMDPAPGRLACVRLANSGSLLLPVSNLTNLLAMPYLALSFDGFAAVMLMPALLVLVIEYAAFRWWFRRSLQHRVAPDASRQLPPLPWTCLLVIAAMLIGFDIASRLGLSPAWPAGLAALVLGSRALATRRRTPVQVLASAQPGFALFVLGLGIVVAGLVTTPAGDAVRRLVPRGDGLTSLLLVAILGAVLANLLNNLPATLVLVPAVAANGPVAVLALLIGINVGSSLTRFGSLANMLWLRAQQHEPIGTNHSTPGPAQLRRDFYGLAAIACPLGIVGGVVVLSYWAPWVGLAPR